MKYRVVSRRHWGFMRQEHAGIKKTKLHNYKGVPAQWRVFTQNWVKAAPVLFLKLLRATQAIVCGNIMPVPAEREKQPA